MALQGKVGRLLAEDVDDEIIQSALDRGLIDSSTGLSQADIVILATPTNSIITRIATVDVKPGALVIDLGSTKRRICDAFDTLPETVMAVGGHPMCGLAENGYIHAMSSLYQGAHFVLCETARTTDRARTLAETLVEACGAYPLWMSRDRHDYLTALTSHVPHLLNFALMQLAMEVAMEDAALYELAAGGFDGATRLARTDEAMIAGMLNTNAEYIHEIVTRLRHQLDNFEAMLEDLPGLQHKLADIVKARRLYTARYGERLIT